MARRNRWDYMKRKEQEPATGEPGDPKCTDCPEPSHTFFIGSKTVCRGESRVKVTRYACGNNHHWVVEELNPPQ